MDFRYRRADSAVFRRSLGVVLVRRPDGYRTTLPGTGGQIWALLSAPATVAEICSVLARRYDVEAQAISADVASLVERLVSQGLVIPCEPDAPPGSVA